MLSRSRQTKHRGAMAIELAVMTPLFTVFMLGIVELGRGMMIQNLVANAAHDGARLAAVDGSTNEEVTSAVQSYMNGSIGLPAEHVNVTIKTASNKAEVRNPEHQLADCESGDKVTVTVQVPFTQVALIKGRYLTRKSLTGSSTFERE